MQKNIYTWRINQYMVYVTLADAYEGTPFCIYLLSNTKPMEGLQFSHKATQQSRKSSGLAPETWI